MCPPKLAHGCLRYQNLKKQAIHPGVKRGRICAKSNQSYWGGILLRQKTASCSKKIIVLLLYSIFQRCERHDTLAHHSSHLLSFVSHIG